MIEEEIICNEDYQECWKCPRAIKGSNNPCMIGQISQNCVVEIKERKDIAEKLTKLAREKLAK